MRGCSLPGRPFPCAMPSCLSAWLTRSSTMLPWPSGTQPGARWRSGGRSSSLACGPSAACSSGSTSRTPGRRSRPRSRSSALLRRGNRQPGWRGRLPLLEVRHFGGQPPRLASMAAATSRSVSRVSSSSGPVTPSSARSRSRAAVAGGSGGSSGAGQPLAAVCCLLRSGRADTRAGVRRRGRGALPVGIVAPGQVTQGLPTTAISVT